MKVTPVAIELFPGSRIQLPLAVRDMVSWAEATGSPVNGEVAAA